jgi:hypothetical protein
MDWWKLKWEAVELLDYDLEERQADYIVVTEDNGIEYVGIGTYSSGELVEVEDIEIKTSN